MRDYTRIDKYLDKLIEDIYPQPQDPGHTAWAEESIQAFGKEIWEVNNVLDLGCGEGFCQPIFERYGLSYMGVCLGEDYQVAKKSGRAVAELDFSFLPLDDESFDLLYSRHSLEHSPFPVLTLMEWHRVSKRYVAIVVPAPQHWQYVGRNHYYVLNDPQWRNLFDVAGFDVTFSYVKKQNMTEDPQIPEVEIEFWYLLEKKKPDQMKEIG